MKNKTVLCEIAFLERFLECYPDSPPFPDDKVQQKLKTWIELYAFLSRSNKVLDCSPRSLAEAAQKNDSVQKGTPAQKEESVTVIEPAKKTEVLPAADSAAPYAE